MLSRPTFNSIDVIPTKGRGVTFTTFLDRDTYDFSHLIDNEVEIDGVVYRCIGIERRSHSGLHRIGEPIGILVPFAEAGDRGLEE